MRVPRHAFGTKVRGDIDPALPAAGGTIDKHNSYPRDRNTLMRMIAERLQALGIELPPVFPPAGSYVGCVIDGDLVHVGGHGPVSGTPTSMAVTTGKVGSDLTLAEGQAAARLTGLSILATLNEGLGDLDRIERFIKVFGMVNVAPGFNQMPAVIDGCSDLLIEVFGERGRHTRSAVGMASLPFDIPVEIELIARLRS